jgi:peptidoglycan/LPS O-acetylase OafA/YrhL
MVAGRKWYISGHAARCVLRERCLANIVGGAQLADRNVIEPLHGLRGLAALTVLAHHTAPVHFAGAIGVTLFFVLSGCLMGRLYLSRDFDAVQIWYYATARFARIYPLFALVVISAGILNAFFGFQIFWMESWEVDRHLVLLGDAHTVWTIAVECHFYVLFLLFWFASSRGKLSLRTLVVIYAALAIAAYFFDGRIDPLRYLHIFVLGMIVARLADAPSPLLEKWAAVGLPLATISLVTGLIIMVAIASDQIDLRSPAPLLIASALVYAATLFILACTGIANVRELESLGSTDQLSQLPNRRSLHADVEALSQEAD